MRYSYLFLLAFSLASMPVRAQAPAHPMMQSSVEVSAQSHMRLIPDSATLYIVIDACGANPADAATRSAEAHRNVMDTLTRLGVKGSQVVVFSYGVSPASAEYGQAVNPANAYVGRTLLLLGTTQLDRIPTLTSAVLGRGATVVMPAQFSVRSEDSVRRAAEQEAFRDARERAASLAKELGGRLGRVIQLTTQQYSGAGAQYLYLPVGPRFQAQQQPTPNMAVDVTISVQWELLE